MGAKQVFAGVMGALFVWGCGVAEPEPVSEPSPGRAAAELVVVNGSHLNGSHLNGSHLNSSSLNQLLVSVRYDGARRTGMSTPMDEVWLQGSVFHGLWGSEELSGIDFQGVRFIGNLEDGGTVSLRIDNVVPGTGDEQDVWRYRVSYQDPKDGLWYPVCKSADGSPADAIPLEGRWDYRQGTVGGGEKLYDATSFTFACEDAALAKCVHYGYKPWQSVNGVSLADYHQACTRMIRADFCGDGSSYTVTGHWVNLFDAVSIQVDTEAWAAEAEWTPEGAHCFTSQTRASEPIQCGDRLVPSCGTSFSSGTLLISEVPPPQP
jgi:hypothetical protein